MFAIIQASKNPSVDDFLKIKWSEMFLVPILSTTYRRFFCFYKSFWSQKTLKDSSKFHICQNTLRRVMLGTHEFIRCFVLCSTSPWIPHPLSSLSSDFSLWVLMNIWAQVDNPVTSAPTLLFDLFSVRTKIFHSDWRTKLCYLILIVTQKWWIGFRASSRSFTLF